MSHSDKEMISFFITTRCNLNCIYCYTNKDSVVHQDQSLDFEFAKAGIDDYYSTNYAKHIRFFGAGEPTMELALIKKILEYAKSKDPKTTSEIQTNGCFSETTGKWLADNIDIIWVSSDGIPEIQNHYRPFVDGSPSSPVLERNLQYLASKCKGVTGIRMTITNENVSNQIQNIDYFRSLGIKNFWVDPMFPSVGEKEAYEKIDMNKFTEEFLKAVKYAYSNGMTYGSILTCNFDKPGVYACRALLPVPHLTTDGFVSACDMALFGRDMDHMDIFIYGKWNPNTNTIEYDWKKLTFLRSRELKNLKKCSKCEVGKYCRGYCPGEVTNETGNLFGCKSNICSSTIRLFHELSEAEKQYCYLHP